MLKVLEALRATRDGDTCAAGMVAFRRALAGPDPLGYVRRYLDAVAPAAATAAPPTEREGGANPSSSSSTPLATTSSADPRWRDLEAAWDAHALGGRAHPAAALEILRLVADLLRADVSAAANTVDADASRALDALAFSALQPRRLRLLHHALEGACGGGSAQQKASKKQQGTSASQQQQQQHQPRARCNAALALLEAAAARSPAMARAVLGAVEVLGPGVLTSLARPPGGALAPLEVQRRLAEGSGGVNSSSSSNKRRKAAAAAAAALDDPTATLVPRASPLLCRAWDRPSAPLPPTLERQDEQQQQQQQQDDQPPPPQQQQQQRDRPTRAALCGLAMAVYASADALLVPALLQCRPLTSALLAHAASDPPAAALKALALVWGRGFGGRSRGGAGSGGAPPHARAAVFDDAALAQLAALAARADDAEVLAARRREARRRRRQKEQQQRKRLRAAEGGDGNEDEEEDEDEDDNDDNDDEQVLAALAHQALVALLTDPAHGLAPASSSSSSSSAPPPDRRVLRLLQRLRPADSAAHARLLEQACVARPALAAELLRALPLALEPPPPGQPLARWLVSVAVATMLVRAAVVQPSSLEELLLLSAERPEAHDSASATAATAARSALLAALPPAASRAALSRGLQHSSSELARHASVVLLSACLGSAGRRLLGPLERAAAVAAKGTHSCWAEQLAASRAAVRSRLPDPSALVALLAGVGVSGASGQDGAGDGGKPDDDGARRETQLAALDALALYQRWLPDASADARADAARVLEMMMLVPASAAGPGTAAAATTSDATPPASSPPLPPAPVQEYLLCLVSAAARAADVAARLQARSQPQAAPPLLPASFAPHLLRLALCSPCARVRQRARPLWALSLEHAVLDRPEDATAWVAQLFVLEAASAGTGEAAVAAAAAAIGQGAAPKGGSVTDQAAVSASSLAAFLSDAVAAVARRPQEAWETAVALQQHSGAADADDEAAILPLLPAGMLGLASMQRLLRVMASSKPTARLAAAAAAPCVCGAWAMLVQAHLSGARLASRAALRQLDALAAAAGASDGASTHDDASARAALASLRALLAELADVAVGDGVGGSGSGLDARSKAAAASSFRRLTAAATGQEHAGALCAAAAAAVRSTGLPLPKVVPEAVAVAWAEAAAGAASNEKDDDDDNNNNEEDQQADAHDPTAAVLDVMLRASIAPPATSQAGSWRAAVLAALAAPSAPAARAAAARTACFWMERRLAGLDRSEVSDATLSFGFDALRAMVVEDEEGESSARRRQHPPRCLCAARSAAAAAALAHPALTLAFNSSCYAAPLAARFAADVLDAAAAADASSCPCNGERWRPAAAAARALADQAAAQAASPDATATAAKLRCLLPHLDPKAASKLALRLAEAVTGKRSGGGGAASAALFAIAASQAVAGGALTSAEAARLMRCAESLVPPESAAACLAAMLLGTTGGGKAAAAASAASAATLLPPLSQAGLAACLAHPDLGAHAVAASLYAHPADLAPRVRAALGPLCIDAAAAAGGDAARRRALALALPAARAYFAARLLLLSVRGGGGDGLVKISDDPVVALYRGPLLAYMRRKRGKGGSSGGGGEGGEAPAVALRANALPALQLLLDLEDQQEQPLGQRKQRDGALAQAWIPGEGAGGWPLGDGAGEQQQQQPVATPLEQASAAAWLVRRRLALEEEDEDEDNSDGNRLLLSFASACCDTLAAAYVASPLPLPAVAEAAGRWLDGWAGDALAALPDALRRGEEEEEDEEGGISAQERAAFSRLVRAACGALGAAVARRAALERDAPAARRLRRLLAALMPGGGGGGGDDEPDEEAGDGSGSSSSGESTSTAGASSSSDDDEDEDEGDEDAPMAPADEDDDEDDEEAPPPAAKPTTLAATPYPVVANALAAEALARLLRRFATTGAAAAMLLPPPPAEGGGEDGSADPFEPGGALSRLRAPLESLSPVIDAAQRDEDERAMARLSAGANLAAVELLSAREEGAVLLEVVADAWRRFGGGGGGSGAGNKDAAAGVAAALQPLVRLLQVSHGGTLHPADRSVYRAAVLLDAEAQRLARLEEEGEEDEEEDAAAAATTTTSASPLALSGFLFGAAAKEFYERLHASMASDAAEEHDQAGVSSQRQRRRRSLARLARCAAEARRQAFTAAGATPPVDPRRAALTCALYPDSRRLSADDDDEDDSEEEEDEEEKEEEQSGAAAAAAANHHRRPRRLCDAAYDPAALLPLALAALRDGSMDLQSFASAGLLAVCLRALASADRASRAAAYSALALLSAQAQAQVAAAATTKATEAGASKGDDDDDNDPNPQDHQHHHHLPQQHQRGQQLQQLGALLAFVRDAVTRPLQRFPAPSALLAAEASLLLPAPGATMHGTVARLLLRQPALDVSGLPLLSRLLLVSGGGAVAAGAVAASAGGGSGSSGGGRGAMTTDSAAAAALQRAWMLRLLWAGMPDGGGGGGGDDDGAEENGGSSCAPRLYRRKFVAEQLMALVGAPSGRAAGGEQRGGFNLGARRGGFGSHRCGEPTAELLAARVVCRAARSPALAGHLVREAGLVPWLAALATGADLDLQLLALRALERLLRARIGVRRREAAAVLDAYSAAVARVCTEAGSGGSKPSALAAARAAPRLLRLLAAAVASRPSAAAPPLFWARLRPSSVLALARAAEAAGGRQRRRDLLEALLLPATTHQEGEMSPRRLRVLSSADARAEADALRELAAWVARAALLAVCRGGGCGDGASSAPAAAALGARAARWVAGVGRVGAVAVLGEEDDEDQEDVGKEEDASLRALGAALLAAGEPRAALAASGS